MALGSFNATIVNSSGDIVPGAEIEVRRTSDNALANLFSDESRTAMTNPFNAHAVTAFAQFFAERDTYTVAASTGAGTVTWTVDVTPSSDGATYAPTRAEAILLNVPAAQDILFVRSDAGLLAYKRDAAGTALTTADGQTWSPDGEVTPQHWGVVASGGDQTIRLDQMMDYLNSQSLKRLHFPAGAYQYGGDGLFMRGQNWYVTGYGASLWRATDGKLLVADARAGIIRNIRVYGLRFYSTVPLGSRENTHGFEFLADPLTTNGFQNVKLSDLSGSGLKSVVHYTETSGAVWQGIDQLQRYYQITVDDLNGDANSGGRGNPEHIVLYDSGTGQHVHYNGGFYRSSDVAFKCGDGVSACHDTTIAGVHFLGSQGGVEIVGPTNPLGYRKNISIIGCQFDAADSGFTYRFENLSDFEVTGCNSQNAVNYQLVNCTAPYTIQDNDRNIITTGSFDAGVLRQGGVNIGDLAAVTITPTLIMFPAGDLVVSAYQYQFASYQRYGDKAYIKVALSCNLSHTSPNNVVLVSLTGLPFSMDSSETGSAGMTIGQISNFTLNALDRMAFVRVNTAATFRIEFLRSGAPAARAEGANIPTGTNRVISFSGWVNVL